MWNASLTATCVLCVLCLSQFGQTGGTFKDSTIRLNGPNSIIGRSLVIMGNGQPGGENVRIAQCVIGKR